MNRISACLITLNEENRLARALASLSTIADEIVVVDSGSTDRTEAITREHDGKFVLHAFTNYSEQRNCAATQAANDWNLCLAPDEELSATKQNSLLGRKQCPPQ